MGRFQILLFGQFISLLYFVGAALASILQIDFGNNAPNFTALCIYLFMCLFLLPLARQRLEKPQDDNASVYMFFGIPTQSSLRSYAFIGLVDYAAIASAIYSLKFTTITSFASIYSLQTPFVMVFSKCYLIRKYSWRHAFGVAVCIVGVSLSVYNDTGCPEEKASSDGKDSVVEALSSDEAESGFYSSKVFGNVLVLFSTIFYALLDILCEVALEESENGTVEYLAMSGVFGSLFSLGPTLILERSAVYDFCTKHTAGLAILSTLIVADIAGSYTSCLFLEFSESALLNISTLTVSFYAVLFAIAYNGDIPVPMFYVGVVLTALGLIIYETGASPKYELMFLDRVSTMLDAQNDRSFSSSPDNSHYNVEDGTFVNLPNQQLLQQTDIETPTSPNTEHTGMPTAASLEDEAEVSSASTDSNTASEISRKRHAAVTVIGELTQIFGF